MPTKLKLLNGETDKRRLNDREPEPTGDLPPCPEYLTGTAREAWNRFAAQVSSCRIATDLDATALELLCAAYAIYLDNLQKTLQHGAVWMEKGESAIPKFVYSPHWAVMNKEWKKVKEMLCQFGMTPSSRSGIQADVPTDDDLVSRYLG